MSSSRARPCAVLALIATAAAGWLGANFSTEYLFTATILDFSAPVVAAIGVSLLILRSSQSAGESPFELRSLVQRGRGTGLSDHATLLTLLSLIGCLIGASLRRRDSTDA